VTTLKRLASAVQLRPWPPCFQSVTTNRSILVLPRGARFFDHKLTSLGQRALEGVRLKTFQRRSPSKSRSCGSCVAQLGKLQSTPRISPTQRASRIHDPRFVSGSSPVLWSPRSTDFSMIKRLLAFLLLSSEVPSAPDKDSRWQGSVDKRVPGHVGFVRCRRPQAPRANQRLQFAEVDRNSKPQPGRLRMRDFEL
jgi:hypothetical protein